MDLKYFFQAALIGLCYIACANCWLIDDSCQKTPALEDLVTRAVEDAMDLAEITLKELQRRPWDAHNDEALVNLANWIMKDPGTNPQISLDLPPLPDRRSNLDKVRDRMDLILTMRDKNIGGGGGNQEAANRFKSPSKAGKLWDSVTKTFFWLPFNDAAIASCEDSEAWTTEAVDANRYSMIQICPDFLENQMNYHWHTAKEMKSGFKIFRGSKYEGTEMDAWLMLDSTMLHEFTHTSQGLAAADIGGQDGAYGWNNIVKKSVDEAAQNAGNYYSQFSRNNVNANNKQTR